MTARTVDNRNTEHQHDVLILGTTHQLNSQAQKLMNTKHTATQQKIIRQPNQPGSNALNTIQCIRPRLVWLPDDLLLRRSVFCVVNSPEICRSHKAVQAHTVTRYMHCRTK